MVKPGNAGDDGSGRVFRYVSGAGKVQRFPCPREPGPLRGERRLSGDGALEHRRHGGGHPHRPQSLPGSCSASPEDFQILAGRLFFLAYDGTSQGIWKTDGTSQGTVLLAPRVNSSQLFIAQAGPNLFFSAENREGGGLQLWTSDGTPEGSEPITAIQGGRGSEPSSFTALGDRALFVSCLTLPGRAVAERRDRGGDGPHREGAGRVLQRHPESHSCRRPRILQQLPEGVED